MRKTSCVLLLFLMTSAVGAEIRILEPRDKLQTFSETVMLQGNIQPPGEIFIEGIPFRTKTDGSFTCGLVLRPGKNYVEIRRGEERRGLRLLKADSYPDIEMLYEDKRHWARSQIVYLSTLGYIEGYPDGNFHPGEAVTRGEFATWLVRVKNVPVPRLAADVFFDVPKEHWRAPYVKAAVDAGFMRGYSNDTFGIDDPISRREAADIAVRVEGLGIIEKIKPLFRDVPPQERGAIPIYTARESGLVVGISEKVPVYDPDRALTRAEAAMLLSRYARAQAGFRGLFDFETGYASDRFCKLNLPPEIISFSVQPGEARLKQKTSLQLRARLVPRPYFFPLSRVKVDLSSIGGMPDAEMFDDGTRGDEEEGDLTYSLNVQYEPLDTGDKPLRVTATDRLGWEGKAETTLLVLE
jgi:hypothetical protein